MCLLGILKVIDVPCVVYSGVMEPFNASKTFQTFNHNSKYKCLFKNEHLRVVGVSKSMENNTAYRFDFTLEDRQDVFHGMFYRLWPKEIPSFFSAYVKLFSLFIIPSYLIL